MKLTAIGTKTKQNIVKYLQEINEYHKLEDNLLLEQTALQFQLYYTTLSRAEADTSQEDYFKLHNLANKFYFNYNSNLKALGIGPVARKKLFIEVDDEEETSIFRTLQTM